MIRKARAERKITSCLKTELEGEEEMTMSWLQTELKGKKEMKEMASIHSGPKMKSTITNQAIEP